MCCNTTDLLSWKRKPHFIFFMTAKSQVPGLWNLLVRRPLYKIRKKQVPFWCHRKAAEAGAAHPSPAPVQGGTADLRRHSTSRCWDSSCSWLYDSGTWQASFENLVLVLENLLSGLWSEKILVWQRNEFHVWIPSHKAVHRSIDGWEYKYLFIQIFT